MTQAEEQPEGSERGADGGCDPMRLTGATPLLRAAKPFDTDSMKLLIAHGAKLDLPNQSGITPMHAVVITSVVSLIDIPLHWFAFGFERMIGLGLWENLLQLIMQGVFSGAGATYLFARSVALLCAGRAAVFPSLVPGFTLLIGFLALG